MKQPYGILIDSSCTVAYSYIKEHDIGMVPLIITKVSNSVSISDIDLKYDQLLQNLSNGDQYKTSASIYGMLLQKASEMLEKYEHVFFLPISQGISSQYSTSLMIKEEFPQTFHPIASTTGGVGNEFILYKLVDLIKSNQTFDQIQQEIEKELQYITTYFSCENTSGIHAGGRLKKMFLGAIKLIKAKPIVCFDNSNHFIGIGKSYKKNIYKMINKAKEQFNNPNQNGWIKHIALYTAGCSEEKVQFLLNALSQEFNISSSQIIKRDVPRSILVHTFPDSYGFCLYTNGIQKTIK